MTRTSMYDILMEIASMMIEDGFTAAEVNAIAAELQKIKAERWEQERLTGRDLGTKMIGGNAWILDKVAIYMEAYFGDTSRDIWADTYEDAAIVSSKCSEIIDPIYHNDDDEPEPETTTSETVFHYYDEAFEFLADALGLQEEPYDRSWWIADPSALIGRGDDPVDVKVDMGRLVNMTCDARLDDESELEELVFLYDMDDPADADLVLDLMWKCSEIVEEETIPEISEADIIEYDDSEIRFIIGSKPDGNPDDYDLDGIRNEIAYADEDGELFYVPGCWDESGRATEKLHEAILRHRRS